MCKLGDPARRRRRRGSGRAERRRGRRCGLLGVGGPLIRRRPHGPPPRDLDAHAARPSRGQEPDARPRQAPPVGFGGAAPGPLEAPARHGLFTNSCRLAAVDTTINTLEREARLDEVPAPCGRRRAAPQVLRQRPLQQFALVRGFWHEGLDRRGRFGQITSFAPPSPFTRRVQVHADDGLRDAVAPFVVQRVVVRRDGVEGEELPPGWRWWCRLFALLRRRRRARLVALAGAEHRSYELLSLVLAPRASLVVACTSAPRRMRRGSYARELGQPPRQLIQPSSAGTPRWTMVPTTE